LDTENPLDNPSVPYVVYFEPKINPSSNYNIPKKSPPQDTPISENDIPDTQTNGSTALLVDYGVQTFAPAPRTSPDTADPRKTPQMSMPHHQLPSMQLLNPTPYKRVSAPLETTRTLTEPNSNPTLSEKLTTAHQSYQTGQFRGTPGNTAANSPVASSEHHISSLATPVPPSSYMHKLSS
jgi:hypothetical protein